MTTTRATHRIDVEAKADAVYRIVADVGLWPLYFPPTVRAERLSWDGVEERIGIWAMADGELRTWQSRRRLHPAARRVEFEQERPRDPVAAMGGSWTLEERGEGCTVVLDHHYRAVDDDPARLARIARAVEHNSTVELDNLRRAVLRAGQEPELLFEFADTETVSGPPEEVYAFLYDAAKWPERIPHVAHVEVREDVLGLQHLRMDTRAPDGSVHTTVSGRVCEPGRRIVYKQTTLPPVLQAHNGEWLVEETGDGAVRVTARHQVILDPEGIAGLAEPPESLAAARDAVREALGANSRATMARARAFAEANRPRTPRHHTKGNTAMAELTLDELKRFLLSAAGDDESVELSGDILHVRLVDLGFDSLAVIDTLGRLERHFGVKLPEEATTEVETPADLLAAVNRQVAEAA
ncbi:SRPBCC family protein [Streptomyces sp. NPDC044989]